jgi:tetratricopeptide (TPR) repeat protein
MTMKHRIFSVWIYLFSFAAYNQTELNSIPNVILKQAKIAFEKRKCAQLISLLKGKKITEELQDESQFIDRYRMLGVCYFHIGDKENAKKELNELLFIDPNFEFDPFVTPPPLLDLFNQLKNNIKAKSQELELAKELAIDKTPARTSKILYGKNSIIPAFLPFGLGQFENRQATKGATMQVSMLSANISFYWWKRSLSGVQGKISTLEQYNLAQTLQFVALGAFLAAYVYGVTDAFLNIESEIKPSIGSTIDITTEAFFQEFEKAKNNF